MNVDATWRAYLIATVGGGPLDRNTRVTQNRDRAKH